MGKVSAGFPSPADDYIEKTLDLNELLVQKPAATFFARAQGNSMTGAGIFPNDILVVDRSIERSTTKISLGKIPAPVMEFPCARAKKVAAGF